LACVPFPAPGPPNKITRIVFLLDANMLLKGWDYPCPTAE
jgi:hypothetical protein